MIKLKFGYHKSTKNDKRGKEAKKFKKILEYFTESKTFCIPIEETRFYRKKQRAFAKKGKERKLVESISKMQSYASYLLLNIDYMPNHPDGNVIRFRKNISNVVTTYEYKVRKCKKINGFTESLHSIKIFLREMIFLGSNWWDRPDR